MEVLERVVQSMERIHEEAYGGAIEDSGSTGEVQMSAVVTGEHGQWLTAAVVGVAKQVEDEIPKVIAASAAKAADYLTPTHGAAVIK